MRYPLSLCTLASALMLGGLNLHKAALAQDASESNGSLRRLEVNATHHRLSAGYDDWHDLLINGDYAQGKHLWSGELLHATRFGESGTYVGVSDRITLAPRWDLSLGYGLGNGGSWVSRETAHAFVHHRWAEQGNWVVHLGTGYARARQTYRDRWSSLGLSAYLEPHLQLPLVAQAEVRWSQSHPGSVDTRQQFLALSWGRQGATQATLRHGWGREGWQLLGDANSITNFASRQDTLTLQHWFSPEWGLKLSYDHYRNDSYRRQGVGLTLFREWP